MIWKVVTLLGLALCAQGEGEPHATSQQMVKKEFEHHGELNHIGTHLPEHHEEYAWAYPSYEFSYSVNDPHTHDIKGQHEHRHGDEVKGEYWFLQPDGKKRTVKYHSDKHKGFKADVQYSEHHKHDHHPEEPRLEEIVKPVEEIIEEEPQNPIVESEPILIEEAPEVVEEERSEKPIELKHHEPSRHKPIHIEYYINHKYRKHHHEEHKKHQKTERAEPEAERREDEAREEESVGETGQEARIREDEVPRKEIKHHKPVHIEYYSKIHHPIHNEHHGHETPKHIIMHHEHREERRGREEQRRREQIHREEQHVREEQRGRDEQRGREEQRLREEQRVREEQRSREEERERNEVHNWGERHGHEEHRGREEQRGREKQRSHEEKRVREEQRSREEERVGNKVRNWGELHGHEEHRGREHHEHQEHIFPLPPVLRPLNIGYHHHKDHDEERRQPELHKVIHDEEIRAERKHDPDVQLHRMHKPVMFRPEHAHNPGYRRDHRRQRKTQ